MEKTKYSFFYKPSKKDDIPPCLPKLIINNYEIKREESIKFLVVLLDQHFTWKEHIKLAENKIAKNIVILYKTRPSLDKRALLCLFYAYILPNRTYLKNFKVNNNALLELSFPKTNLHIHRNFSKKIIY